MYPSPTSFFKILSKKLANILTKFKEFYKIKP
nr:MAG TPA: hypothetical protein [Caudoviricetes sp.]